MHIKKDENNSADMDVGRKGLYVDRNIHLFSITDNQYQHCFKKIRIEVTFVPAIQFFWNRPPKGNKNGKCIFTSMILVAKFTIVLW